MAKRIWILVVSVLAWDAMAGMPVVRMTDVARMRLSAISFFLVVFLLCAWAVQVLWNRTLCDLINLPKLTYKKALGVMLLWGFLFTLVLTMISGARELMTPGAWKKDGILYKIEE